MNMREMFSDDNRRDPYPMYERIRAVSPVLNDPQSGLWFVFDYDDVLRVLSDHQTFSSAAGPAQWLVFVDPPRHTKLRALVSKGFTPRSVANLEARIVGLSRRLLDETIAAGTMDLARDFAVPLPMRVIAELLGIAANDRADFSRWNDAILNMSYTIGRRDEQAAQAVAEFSAVSAEMNDYLTAMLEERASEPRDDLLTRLMNAEIDGERLTQADILGFFQGLLLAGSETTTNLINNAILCLIENPGQMALLEASPGLLPSAIEEVLRYRSPLQWMFRRVIRDVELKGQTLCAGVLVLPMMGAANHDPRRFSDPRRFDIARDPNPHLAFGHGVHFCLGAPLARLEARVALGELLARVKNLRRANDEPWEPRKGLHVHGPCSLPIRFEKRG